DRPDLIDDAAIAAGARLVGGEFGQSTDPAERRLRLHQVDIGAGLRFRRHQYSCVYLRRLRRRGVSAPLGPCFPPRDTRGCAALSRGAESMDGPKPSEGLAGLGAAVVPFRGNSLRGISKGPVRGVCLPAREAARCMTRLTMTELRGRPPGFPERGINTAVRGRSPGCGSAWPRGPRWCVLPGC